MLLIISFLSFILCLLVFIPVDKIIPVRHLRRSNNHLLSKQVNVTYSSVLVKKLHPMLDKIAAFFRINDYASLWSRYRNLIKIANIEQLFDIRRFVALKILTVLAIALYFFLLNLRQFSVELTLVGVLTAFIGFFLPDQWLGIRIKQRKFEIQRQIPSIMLSLAITTDAGLSLLQALEEVCERKKGELSSEFRKTLDEITIGIPQREAFENMIRRVLIDELTIIISTIIQTLEKGSAGMTHVLREQANQSWQKRKSRARELGEKASIKLFLPLIAFILPALMIFIVSPAVFSIIQFFDF